MNSNLKEYINIFENKINENIIDGDLIIKIIDEISNLINNFNETEEIAILNDNLKELLASMQDSDYLRFLDILKYEIMPLMDSIF